MRNFAALVSSLALLAAGCATQGYTFLLPGAPELAPTSPDSVTVYPSADSLPCDRYDSIARMEVEGRWYHTGYNVREKMREEAAGVGANAVIMRGIARSTAAEAMSTSGETKKARAIAVRLDCDEP